MQSPGLPVPLQPEGGNAREVMRHRIFEPHGLQAQLEYVRLLQQRLRLPHWPAQHSQGLQVWQQSTYW